MRYVEARIRDAISQDDELLARIIRESFRDVAERFGLTPENCPTHPSNCTPQWIASEMAKGVAYYVVEEGGTPCGCVALERAGPEVCYLERLAVLPSHRRSGYGTALVHHVLEEARRVGAGRLEFAIIARQSGLRDWYERLGFAVKNTKSFSHLPFDVTFMFAEL